MWWWLAAWRAPAAVATPAWNAAVRRAARQRRAQGTTSGWLVTRTGRRGSGGTHVTHTQARLNAETRGAKGDRRFVLWPKTSLLCPLPSSGRTSSLLRWLSGSLHAAGVRQAPAAPLGGGRRSAPRGLGFARHRGQPQPTHIPPPAPCEWTPGRGRPARWTPGGSWCRSCVTSGRCTGCAPALAVVSRQTPPLRQSSDSSLRSRPHRPPCCASPPPSSPASLANSGMWPSSGVWPSGETLLLGDTCSCPSTAAPRQPRPS